MCPLKLRQWLLAAQFQRLLAEEYSLSWALRTDCMSKESGGFKHHHYPDSITAFISTSKSPRMTSKIHLKRSVLILLFPFAWLSVVAQPDSVIAGNNAEVLFEGPVAGGLHLTMEITADQYPLPAGQNPAYQFEVNPPVVTDRVRYVTNDGTAHVTEIRLFEPGIPFYPDVMSEGDDGLGITNFALNAPVTASSRWANERHERLAVDGSLAFESRWVSGSGRPHWLEIDLQQERAIGCIQMVSGYLSGAEWLRVAEDYWFEYLKAGEWHEIPGSGRQAGAEPSRMGFVLSSDQGSYQLIHRQEANNWKLMHALPGSEAVVKEYFQLPDADVRQGVPFRKSLVVTGNSVVFLVNGRPMYSFSHDLGVELTVSAAGFSEDVVLHLNHVESEVSPTERSVLLGNLHLGADGQEEYPFRFNPLTVRHNLALARSGIDRVVVEAIPGVAGQQVSISGQDVTQLEITIQGQEAVDVPVRVVSADGSQTREYRILVTPVPPWNGYELAFADEFDGSELDDTKWRYRIGTRWDSVQRAQNVSVRDGRLVIDLEVDADGTQYTGGVISLDQFGHGYYETRARLWKNTGWHAAFWQMQVSGTRVNEIDGFESVLPDSFTSNLQYYHPRHILGSQRHEANVAAEYNVYGWEWLPDRVRFYLNGKLIRESLYPGPHLPAEVWLSCVARTNASTDDLPGTIEFEYFRYYRPIEDRAGEIEDALVVDMDSDGYSESGTWETSEFAVSHRWDLRTRVSEVPGSTARWEANLERSGFYDVYVWNPYIFSDGNHSQATYRLQQGDKVTERLTNPMADGQAWVSLGRHRFSGDEPVSVTMEVDGSQSHRADAVAFRRVATSNAGAMLPGGIRHNEEWSHHKERGWLYHPDIPGDDWIHWFQLNAGAWISSRGDIYPWVYNRLEALWKDVAEN